MKKFSKKSKGLTCYIYMGETSEKVDVGVYGPPVKAMGYISFRKHMKTLGLTDVRDDVIVVRIGYRHKGFLRLKFKKKSDIKKIQDIATANGWPDIQNRPI